MSDTKHHGPTHEDCRGHAEECDRILACCAPVASGADGAAPVGAGDLGVIKDKLLAARTAFQAGDYWTGVALLREAVLEALEAWQPAPVFSASADAQAGAGSLLGRLLQALQALLLRLIPAA